MTANSLADSKSILEEFLMKLLKDKQEQQLNQQQLSPDNSFHESNKIVNDNSSVQVYRSNGTRTNIKIIEDHALSPANLKPKRSLSSRQKSPRSRGLTRWNSSDEMNLGQLSVTSPLKPMRRGSLRPSSSTNNSTDTTASEKKTTTAPAAVLSGVDSRIGSIERFRLDKSQLELLEHIRREQIERQEKSIQSKNSAHLAAQKQQQQAQQPKRHQVRRSYIINSSHSTLSKIKKQNGSSKDQSVRRATSYSLPKSPHPASSMAAATSGLKKLTVCDAPQSLNTLFCKDLGLSRNIGTSRQQGAPRMPCRRYDVEDVLKPQNV